ncbi:MAG: TIGR03790 family protein [Puniceicoccaceae bacterium]
MRQFLPWFTLLCLTAVSAFARTAPDPGKVVVIANATVPESLELAQFYLESRSIPQENLIVLHTSTEATIPREQFIREILHPVREQLLERGLVEGTLLDNITDDSGRYAFQVYETQFHYLVLCMGVPLKVASVAITPDAELSDRIPAGLQTTQASVDSELALVAASNQRWLGPVANPLFQVPSPTQLDYTEVISVCRLEGPTFEHAKSLVRDAIAAEQRSFLSGRAYIDLHSHHADGNLWLREAATHLRAYGYDVELIPPGRHWSITDRHDAPAIYLGWYQVHAAGPMLPPASIPTGAIGAHIHSYSAASLRTPSRNWAGPLVNAGFTVTFGNVYEPYLQLTLRPDLFIELLLRGYCLGDASLYAQPSVSWQNVTLGDPLYQPFQPTHEWNPIHILNSSDSTPYERIIALNRIASQNTGLACQHAVDAQTQFPSIPLAIKILETWSNHISTSTRNQLHDYLSSRPMIPSSLAPFYLNTFKSLRDTDDANIAQRFMQLMHQSRSQWEPELQESFDSISSTHDSHPKPTDSDAKTKFND